MTKKGKASIRRKMTVDEALDLAAEQYFVPRRYEGRRHQPSIEETDPKALGALIGSGRVTVRGYDPVARQISSQAIRVQRKEWDLNSFWDNESKSFKGLEFITDDDVRHHVMDLLKERHEAFHKELVEVYQLDQELAAIGRSKAPWHIKKGDIEARKSHLRGQVSRWVRSRPRIRAVQTEVLNLLNKYW